MGLGDQEVRELALPEGAALGQWVRRRRTALRLTQAELARETDYSAVYVRKIEAGARPLPWHAAARFAEALDLEGTLRRDFIACARGHLDPSCLPAPGAAGMAGTSAPRERETEPRSRPSTLPVPPHALISRRRDVAAVLAALRDIRRRVVTLTGSAGVGKTHLALEVAALSGGFPDGVWWVELASVSAPELVRPAIAGALGIREDALSSYLAGKDMLLVLDNFEHVRPAAPVVAELVGASRRIRALVTSRAPLGLRAERRLEVRPLAVPNLERLPEPGALRRIASVDVFAHLAREAQPDFRVNDANAVPVAAVCARLDGIPLALELAAARLRRLPSVEALLAQLQSPLSALTGGPADLPDRQRTWWNAVAWSYGLLRPHERAVFRRLAVFAGGWTLEAAQAVCAADAAQDVPAALSALVEQSLIRVGTDGEPAGRDDSTARRYSILESIREYALDRLKAEGELEETAREHASFFLGLAERVGPDAQGPRSTTWLDLLEREHHNLRAALEWALGHGEARMAHRLSRALWSIWDVRGRWTEARQFLERALATSPAGADAAALAWRAETLHRLGRLAQRQGNDAQAREWYAQAVDLFRELEDVQGEAAALCDLGYLLKALSEREDARACFQRALDVSASADERRGMAGARQGLGYLAMDGGEPDDARRLFEAAREDWRAVGDPRAEASTVELLGHLAGYGGDYAAAHAYFQEALRTHEAREDLPGIAAAQFGLGRAAGGQSDFGAARAHLERALLAHRELGNVRAQVDALNSLAEVALCESDLACADQHVGDAQRIMERLGHAWAVAEVLHMRGHLAIGRGNHVQAAECFSESLSLRCAEGNARGAAMSLVGLAVVALRTGDPARATWLLGAAHAVRTAKNAGMRPLDWGALEETERHARARLGAEAFSAAWEAGRATPSGDLHALAAQVARAAQEG